MFSSRAIWQHFTSSSCLSPYTKQECGHILNMARHYFRDVRKNLAIHEKIKLLLVCQSCNDYYVDPILSKKIVTIIKKCQLLNPEIPSKPLITIAQTSPSSPLLGFLKRTNLSIINHFDENNLLIACYRNDLNTFKLLFSKFVSSNKKQITLYQIILTSHKMSKKIFNYILQSPELMEHKNVRAFHLLLCITGDLLMLKQINRPELACDTYDPHHNNGLLLAAYHKHPDIIQWLLEHGADPTRKNRKNLTALFIAIQVCNVPSMLLLLNQRVTPCIIDGQDLNPFEYALYLVLRCQNKFHKERCLKSKKKVAILLEKILPHLYQLGYRARITSFMLSELSHCNNDFIFKLTHYVDLRTEDPEGNTLLHFAQTVESVQFLMDQGFLIAHHNHSKQTLLHQATQRGDTELIAFLIEKGLSPFDKNALGQNAFQLALEHSRPVFIELMSMDASKEAYHALRSELAWDICQLEKVDYFQFIDPPMSALIMLRKDETALKMALNASNKFEKALLQKLDTELFFLSHTSQKRIATKQELQKRILVAAIWLEELLKLECEEKRKVYLKEVVAARSPLLLLLFDANQPIFTDLKRAFADWQDYELLQRGLNACKMRRCV